MPIRLPLKPRASVAAPACQRADPIELLTIKQAINVAKVSDATLRRWINSGTLPAFKIGKQIRIDRAELLKLLRPWSPNRAL